MKRVLYSQEATMQHLSAFVLLLLPCSVPAQTGTITLPTGTNIPLVVVRPVFTEGVKVGDPIYAQTTFPIVSVNTVAVPSGSYVQGRIDSVLKPTKKSHRATLTLHLTTIILANGYILPLADSAAQSTLQIQATPANDLLLDNGAQLDVTLATPLFVDNGLAATALAASKPNNPGQFSSATRCRPAPATSGSPDTVIPETPGSPGTPDTVIPGIDGGAPTIIPGIPATPGTPSITMAGTPGSPGSACPAAPLVLSSTSPAQSAQITTNRP